MTFDKLADRCLLFVDERKQMLIELLKEAELEISRKVNMYEDIRTYNPQSEDSYGIPSNFKQVIVLHYNGDILVPITEDEIDYNSDGTVQTGTPTGYFIRNNGIHLNYKAASGTLRLSYYGTVDNVQDGSTTPEPIIPQIYHRDLCDYAIAIASAKNRPDMHDKHLMIWNSRIQELVNEDADRELVNRIKEDI